MSYGPMAVYTVTMASGGTLTGGADIARSYKNVFLEIPTMNSNTQLHVWGSSDNSTFRRVYQPMQNSAAPTGALFTINSAVTGALVPIPNGIRYVKVESTATVDNGCVFKMICSD